MGPTQILLLLLLLLPLPLQEKREILTQQIKRFGPAGG